MFTLMGYYQLPNDSQPQLVNFTELFDTGFMRKYTRYRSFEKFLNGSGFSITCQKEMLDTATDKHIIKHRFSKQANGPAAPGN